MTATDVRAEVYIGVRDMALHQLAAGARLTDYPKPPAGPGTTGTRLLARCQDCLGRARNDT